MCSVSTCVLSALCVSGFVPGADTAGGAEIKAAQPGPVESRSLGVGPKLLMSISGTVRGEKGWLFALDFILASFQESCLGGWTPPPTLQSFIASYIFIPTELAVSYCTHFLHICLLFQIVLKSGDMFCVHTHSHIHMRSYVHVTYLLPHTGLYGEAL